MHNIYATEHKRSGNKCKYSGSYLNEHETALLQFTPVMLETTHDGVMRGYHCQLQFSRHVLHAGSQPLRAREARRASHLMTSTSRSTLIYVSKRKLQRSTSNTYILALLHCCIESVRDDPKNRTVGGHHTRHHPRMESLLQKRA